MRGDDQVEPPVDVRQVGRQLEREVRPNDPWPADAVDGGHLDRVAETRAQEPSDGPGAGTQVQRAGRRRQPHPRVVQDAGQCQLGPGGDFAGVLFAQLGVGQVGLADQLARADEPLVDGRTTPAGAGAHGIYPRPKMSLKVTITRTPSSSTNPAVWTIASSRGLTRLRVIDSTARNIALPPSSAGTGRRLKRPR